MPRLAIVITHEQESAASGRVDSRSVDAIWNFAIRENRVGEAPTETTVRRSESLAAVTGDHHAVVVRADENHIGARRMNGDGVDLELARSGDHPRVGIAAFIRAPETFGRAGENESGHRRMLQDGARATRLRRNALDLAPAITSSLTLVDTAASRSNDVIGIPGIYVDLKKKSGARREVCFFFLFFSFSYY